MRSLSTAVFSIFFSKRNLSLFLGLVLFCIATNWLLADSLASLAETLAASLQIKSVVAILVFLGLSSDIVLPIPSSFISIWAVVSLGFSVGFFTIWAGLSCSCVLGYVLGIYSRDWLTQHFFKQQDLEKTQALMDRFGTTSIVLLRAIPVLAEVSVFTAGVARMRFGKFLAVSTLANCGIALIYASASKYLQQQESLILVFLASIAVPLCAYGVYFFIKHNIVFKQARKPLESQTKEVIGTATTLKPSFNLHFEYPLHFGKNVFHSQNTTFIDLIQTQDQDVRVLFFIDQGLAEGQPQILSDIENYCKVHNVDFCQSIHILPGGDQIKTTHHVEQMLDSMMQAALDRQSYVCAIGGGALLDAVGFAAATFHRGVRLIRMPTTVLAQNDAGVGVKNGVNDKGVKNLLGSFAIPHAIINDATFLESLSPRDFRAGFAEAVKVALIRDGDFYQWIYEHRHALAQRDPQATEYLIYRCAQLHLNQICFGGDPFERGSARPLDYGHWSAHKLESLTQHELNHGEAVAIGMVIDALYAVEAGHLTQTEARHLISLLQDLGFTLYHSAVHATDDKDNNKLILGLEEFRQHLGGNLSITLLTSLGTAVEVSHIQSELMLNAFNQLSALH